MYSCRSVLQMRLREVLWLTQSDMASSDGGHLWDPSNL